MQLVPVLVVTLATLVGGRPARAQAWPCPDQRADNVPAHFATSGTVNQCATYFQFLGLSIVIGKHRCPTTELLHPAHQECFGTAHAGTDCVKTGEMPAYRRDCQCKPADGGAMGSVDEMCICTDWMQSGTIEDYATVECSFEPTAAGA
jgi:hypothetical protein